ncbi:unnamed protein product [Auanema sp. JU1783]|nr:unnamed protein product [Auanema sp. JU1783]
MSKYWGDERHSDAIYAVYLKKVRYVPPPGYDGVPRYRPIDPDRQPVDQDMGADHLQWESVKERVIKAGTVEKLVECLVGADDLMDSRHFNVFFATYRSFADPPTVLNRILRRYESLENDVNCSTSALVIQNSLRSILICWLDMYPEDFYEPQSDFSSINTLLEFGMRYKLSDLRTKARKLREHFKRIQAVGGLIAQLPSVEQRAYDLGYDSAEYSKNAKDRVRMFDVGKENCVQIAEQLTFWDAALFKEVFIHQCQGCVWSKRHKLSADRVYTVKATIEQFNAVSQRVMTSIVLPECRPDFRAQIIAKWIDISRELRALKNFSSLKAVVSTLQSEPVHRLRQTWALVPSQSMAQFNELKSIYDMDEDGDEHNARRILEQEGTAKSSPLRRPQLIQNCRRTKSDVNLAECQGTVPYLGSFLTDLTMIDQGTSDYSEEGLINFEKRRKEFDVLAKLRLFQSAARAYKIPMDPEFCAWFHYLPCLDEKQCFLRSQEIEKPPPNSTPDMHSRMNTSSTSNGNSSAVLKSSTLSRLFGRQPDESVFNQSSTSNSNFHSHSHSQSSSHSVPNGSATPPLMGQLSRDSGFHCEDWIDGRVDGGPPGPVPLSDSLPRNNVNNCNPAWKSCEFSPSNVFLLPHQRSNSGDSTQEIRTSLSRSSIGGQSASNSLSRTATPILHRLNEVYDSARRRHQQKDSDASSCSSSSHQSQAGLAGAATTFHLARVGLDDGLQSSESGANYKVIKVENGDRMHDLISRALEKHLIDDDHSKYCLLQLLPKGGEFQLPEKCNPFYAIAPDESSHMLNLILRFKKRE